MLAYLLQRGEESRALAVLRRPNISHELIYKFAPVCALYIELEAMSHYMVCKACFMRMATQLKRLADFSISVKQALLAAVPGDTIDAWIACKPPLDARRLLPALMNACEASPASQLQHYALRFVEHCISQLQSTDTTLHNLAVCHTFAYCALCIAWGTCSLSALEGNSFLYGQTLYLNTDQSYAGEPVQPGRRRAEAAAVPAQRSRKSGLSSV